jgi:hypothetical protein
MTRGRARYQRGRVVATEAGGWEIHYNVYLTDPQPVNPKDITAAAWLAMPQNAHGGGGNHSRGGTRCGERRSAGAGSRWHA